MEVLAARYVLPIASAPIDRGAVVIDGGRIVAVGAEKQIRKDYPAAPVTEFPSHVLLPGLVDAYASLDLCHFDADDLPARFIDWQVATLSFRQEQSALKRRSAILDGLQRALANGTTTLADTSDCGQILDTLQTTGLRLMVAPEITGTTDADQQAVYDRVFDLVDQIEQSKSQRLRAAIAPHSPYALSRHLLKILSQQAQANKTPILMRAAASFAEMEFFYESKGEIADVFFPKLGWVEERPPAHRKTPVQYLQSIGLLSERTSLVGCSHLSDPDLDTLAAAQCSIIHCPTTARYFDLGLAPVKKLRKGGNAVGFGTTGLGAVHGWTLWDTMRAALELHSKIKREALSADTVLRMGTLEGARALQWDDTIGSLEVGKQADLIVVETKPRQSIQNVPENLIRETTSSRITKVYVGGTCLK